MDGWVILTVHNTTLPSRNNITLKHFFITPRSEDGSVVLVEGSPYETSSGEEPRPNKHATGQGASSRVRSSRRRPQWALQWPPGFWCWNVKRPPARELQFPSLSGLRPSATPLSSPQRTPGRRQTHHLALRPLSRCSPPIAAPWSLAPDPRSVSRYRFVSFFVLAVFSPPATASVLAVSPGPSSKIK